MTYFKNDENYRAWQLNTRRYTWISIEDLNIFLAHKGGKAKFVKRKQKDDSDRWLLVDETSKRYKAKFKTVNSDKCQKKFVIKNKETERILDVPQKFLELNERDERISQLWTLEPQHKFGSFIIRNGANK